MYQFLTLKSDTLIILAVPSSKPVRISELSSLNLMAVTATLSSPELARKGNYMSCLCAVQKLL